MHRNFLRQITGYVRAAGAPFVVDHGSNCVHEKHFQRRDVCKLPRQTGSAQPFPLLIVDDPQAYLAEPDSAVANIGVPRSELNSAITTSAVPTPGNKALIRSLVIIALVKNVFQFQIISKRDRLVGLAICGVTVPKLNNNVYQDGQDRPP